MDDVWQVAGSEPGPESEGVSPLSHPLQRRGLGSNTTLLRTSSAWHVVGVGREAHPRRDARDFVDH